MKLSYKKVIKSDSMSSLKQCYTDEYALDHKRKYLQMLNKEGDEGIRQFKKVSKIKELAGDLKGRKILDLGCGVGTFALEFAKMGNITIGFDFNEKMISIGKELAEMQGIKQADFAIGEADNLPYEDETFDLVIASDIIEHLIPQVLQRALRQSFRVLKKGGTLIIHTQPTRYISAFNSKKKLLLTLPLCWLPPLAYEAYLELLNYHLFPHIRLLIRGDEGISMIHVNLPSPIGLKKELLKTGFQIKEWYLRDLYPEIGPKYLKALNRFIPFYNRQFLHRNIFAVADKPKFYDETKNKENEIG